MARLTLELVIAITGVACMLLGGMILGPNEPMRIMIGSGLMVGGGLAAAVTIPFIVEPKY